jgi:hypothetical protein
MFISPILLTERLLNTSLSINDIRSIKKGSNCSLFLFFAAADLKNGKWRMENGEWRIQNEEQVHPDRATRSGIV